MSPIQWRPVLWALAFILMEHEARSALDPIGFEWKNRALSFYGIPIQDARANTFFSLRLAPYISVLKPEIGLQLKNNLPFSMKTIRLTQLPVGATRVFVGADLCAETPALDAKQSCMMRFEIDPSQYRSAPSTGPMVHYPGNAIPLGVPFDAAARSVHATQVWVIPAVQDGLQYDPASHSLLGTPTRIGPYHFTVYANNGSSGTIAQSIDIHVAVNLKDKPVLKWNPLMPSATPNQEYHFDLMELLESRPSFGTTNQISFRMDSNHTHRFPSWLRLDQTNPTILQGVVPSDEAGQIKELTIIAHSNTGGDSEPLTLQIPVAFDPSKKPLFKDGIALHGAVGMELQQDFRSLLIDPASDGRLMLFLENVEPSAPWLSISSANPTLMTGIVPEEAVGQAFRLTLYANTPTGGNSDPVIIPLTIAINPQWTPRFLASKPQLPILNAGQAYQYDFMAHGDVFPEYEDAPYSIEFATDYPHPAWLRIDNNVLIADVVPEGWESNPLPVFLRIKNGPGGLSEVMMVDLYSKQSVNANRWDLYSEHMNESLRERR